MELASVQQIKPQDNGLFASLFSMKLGDFKALYHLDKQTCRVKNAEGTMNITMKIGGNEKDKTSKTASNKNNGITINISTNFVINEE